MMMRRMTALLMAALLMLSLASCGTMNSKKGMGDKGSAGSMEPAMTDKQDMGGKDAMMDKDMGGEDAMMDKEGMDSAEGDMMHFPAFEGMDLEGNAVKSDELFGGSAATVVNFWFTTCGPCVGELSELDALNRELSEKGAALIGINAFTLGGDKTAIADAKDVLAKKGATYRNVYFDADSEAGMFASDVYAFPTTYVVDRNGAIVGGPIVGALTEQKQMDALQELVDQAVAMDAKHMG